MSVDDYQVTFDVARDDHQRYASQNESAIRFPVVDKFTKFQKFFRGEIFGLLRGKFEQTFLWSNVPKS